MTQGSSRRAKPRFSYDGECLEPAEYFLPKDAGLLDREKLAQTISWSVVYEMRANKMSDVYGNEKPELLAGLCVQCGNPLTSVIHMVNSADKEIRDAAHTFLAPVERPERLEAGSLILHVRLEECEAALFLLNSGATINAMRKGMQERIVSIKKQQAEAAL